MKDKEIAAAITLRDEVAFNRLIKEYSKLLWAVGWSIIGKQGSAEDLEELVSDVFLRFWNQPEKYDEKKGSLKNYLALMTKSMALNRLKAQQKIVETDDVFLLETIPEKEQADDAIWRAFFQAIETLSEPTRTICFQRFFLEWKPAFISERLQLSVDEVNRRLYRGKKKIQIVMDKLLKEGAIND